MRLNVRFVVVILFLLVAVGQGFAENTDELTTEELEILKNLDFLEHLDLLEEDLEIIEKLEESGEKDE